MHYLFTVTGAFLLKDIDENALTDLPIEHDQSRIHRLGHALAGVIDQFPQIVKRPGRRDRRECSSRLAQAAMARAASG